jgi:NADH-quinone oxidoreductase subunit L
MAEGLFTLAPAIAVLPLVSFVLALFAGKYMPKKGAFAGIAATGGSLLLSLAMLYGVATGHSEHVELYTWTTGVGTMDLQFGLLLDQLSTLMLVIVSLISFLVHVFSLGYMNDEGETGLPRYYAELGLFTFSMLAFVYSDNLLMAFMFFELVGLCSYLLIGFCSARPRRRAPRRRRSWSRASGTTSSSSASSPSSRRSGRPRSAAQASRSRSPTSRSRRSPAKEG